MKKKKKAVKTKVGAVRTATKKIKPKTSAVKKNKVAKKTSPKKKSKKKSSDIDLECFLTSACINHFHLPYDAHELNTLRNYRDQYLRSFEDGRLLVDEYYRLAPAIVKRIENDKEKEKVYAFIFREITKACKKIENNALHAARLIYTELVKNLQVKYKVTLN